MARPTGIQSRARRIPIDIDDAVQAEADRRNIGWADELRRMYLTVKAEPVSSGTSGFPTSDEGTERPPKASRKAVVAGLGSDTKITVTGVDLAPGEAERIEQEVRATITSTCTCAKPTLSAASGMRVCTTCHLPRRT